MPVNIDFLVEVPLLSLPWWYSSSLTEWSLGCWAMRGWKPLSELNNNRSNVLWNHCGEWDIGVNEGILILCHQSFFLQPCLQTIMSPVQLHKKYMSSQDSSQRRADSVWKQQDHVYLMPPLICILEGKECMSNWEKLPCPKFSPTRHHSRLSDCHYSSRCSCYQAVYWNQLPTTLLKSNGMQTMLWGRLD